MTHQRLLVLDALRGFAMVWMTLYHFCFDLNSFGWIKQDFYTDPFWTWQRSAIVSLFLFCVGWSQMHVMHFRWKRWLQIAGCALLVTVGSYAMYPKSFIYFGVLHGVAMMLLLLWALRRCMGPKIVLGCMFGYVLVGVLCLCLFVYPPVVLNVAPWNVLGLISQKPMTEDYVPLLPWFALVVWGYAFGCWYQNRAQANPTNAARKKGLNLAFNPLVKLGQHSLLYYMLHQPVLIGILYLFNLGRLA